jgi:phosphate transport system permease protein
LNEYNTVAMAVNDDGSVRFFEAKNGNTMNEVTLPLEGKTISSISAGAATTGVFSYGFSDGHALVFQERYKVTYPTGTQRVIVPEILYPFGEKQLLIDEQGQAIDLLSVQSYEDKTTFAAYTQDKRLVLKRFEKEVNFLDDTEFTIKEEAHEIVVEGASQLTNVKLDIDQRELYLVDNKGFVYYYDVQNLNKPRLIQKIKAVPTGVDITSFEFLTGGISVLVGRSDGQIDQWFPVRDKDNNYTLHNVRSFAEQDSPIIAIAPEQARKGFVTLDETGHLGIYHTTAHRTLLVEPFVDSDAVIALSPRANGLISITDKGDVTLLDIDNEHPDISWHSLWEKVWYESRDKPEYIWQSSSASNDFEPKFSLTPLTFGTIKAAFYAMLVAVPLAIIGEIFTA